MLGRASFARDTKMHFVPDDPDALCVECVGYHIWKGKRKSASREDVAVQGLWFLVD